MFKIILTILKSLLALAIFSAIAISIMLLFTVLFGHSIAAEPTQITQCPVGSYNVGNDMNGPICKLEPTGCPYGDSIPLGPTCDKFAPADEPTIKDDIEIEEASIIVQGK